MPALGTCLIGTAPFAGDHSVEATASGEGNGLAALAPTVLVGPGARFDGFGAATALPVIRLAPGTVLSGRADSLVLGAVSEIFPLSARGVSGADVRGVVPRPSTVVGGGASAGAASPVVRPCAVIGGSPSDSGEGRVALLPVVLITPESDFSGLGEGVVRGAADTVFPLSALGLAGAFASPVARRLAPAQSAGLADGLVLPVARLQAAAIGQGGGSGRLVAYPMYLGEGVRVDFRDVDAFPQITFDEVFR